MPSAYAVYVVGASMEPRYFAGELVMIHPGKPVTLGAFVLVQKRPKHDGDPPLAVIKRLVKRTASKVTLEQFNPAQELRHQDRRHRLDPPRGGRQRGVMRRLGGRGFRPPQECAMTGT